ncbi:hypothetical protein [Streptomyces parvus]|uniref:Uncharacterized protein n=1 Tax=Streptomyces parvus TaxID=66428 RepID=A0A7K3S1J0_9ACTN|nr:hypothetical protein [Streptomyces parvus]NEC21153.1 hypothetical protein [Streptomyces parvus]NEE41216.1 hypothetical protein [Streptomyces sp. SID7982]
MLQTLKTYASPDRKVSFLFSYEEKDGVSSTLSIFGDKDESITVDLAPEDLKALSSTLLTAVYITADSL